MPFQGLQEHTHNTTQKRSVKNFGLKIRNGISSSFVNTFLHLSLLFRFFKMLPIKNPFNYKFSSFMRDKQGNTKKPTFNYVLYCLKKCIFKYIFSLSRRIILLNHFILKLFRYRYLTIIFIVRTD
jgi:hypothetical protein